MKDLQKLAQLVKDMRASQKEYFRTRDKNILLQSKELERQVDNLLSADDDLFSSPVKKEGWMNLYKRDFGLVQGDLVRDSEEAAKKIAAGDEDYIATIKVEWEE